MIDMRSRNFGPSAKKLFIKDGEKLLCLVHEYKNDVKDFYYDVILSKYSCPTCHGKLTMAGTSRTKCMLCNQILDPTLVFQESSCCGEKLILKYSHYACSHCNKTIPSKFLFDERIIDKSYFREMMKESRDRAKKRQEEIKRFMIQPRSRTFELMDEPILENVPGLVEALDNFVHAQNGSYYDHLWKSRSSFQMSEYKKHILGFLGWGKKLFSSIMPLHENHRLDRIWRFVALIFMQQEGEVKLTQYENDLWVQKIYDEAND